MKHTTLLTKLTEYGEAWELVGFMGYQADDDFHEAAVLKEEVILLFEDIRSKEFSLILDQRKEISALKEKVNDLKQRCRK